MKMTEEEKELKRAERRKAARIRYRMKCGKTYEEAIAEDNGDTGNVIMIGDMKLSDMVTRPAYLRIYNRILHKTPELEAVEIERKNHPECFLTEQQRKQKKETISMKRRIAATGKKAD